MTSSDPPRRSGALERSRLFHPSERCRFAPTTSGPAHPGTLLAALLCWLDARSRNAWLLLRLEDVDASRCTPEHADEMRRALEWLGLDWDAEQLQSEARDAHLAALTALAESGLVYACRCSRSRVRRAGMRAADGGWRYPGTCRDRLLEPGQLVSCGDRVRLRLQPGGIALLDESGLDLSQDPWQAMGDPVLRTADGAPAYHLAAVSDDARAGVTRVVRGRDLAPSSATQVWLQRALGVSTPVYRHHLLLREPRKDKLAKLHGSVGWPQLREAYTPEQLCGWLAWSAGLRPDPSATRPAELLQTFDWAEVATRDRAVAWDGGRLRSA